jgi:hypothetical protein
MKRSLVDFANAFANLLGLMDWQLNGESAPPGGQILLLEGESITSDLQRTLVKSNCASGNKNIDMLYCVPPTGSSILSQGSGDVRSSSLSGLLESWGYPTWDGVNREERLTFPTSVDQCRIVQFDSSRGLEGWIVVLNSLDEFYEHKTAVWNNTQVPGQMFDPDAAGVFAAHWVMIPVTRAIDTLVITVRDKTSKVGSLLFALADRLPDIVRRVA